jgi:hypothetical protein
MYRLHLELVGAPNNVELLDLLIRCAIATWNSLGEGILNRLIDTMCIGARLWRTRMGGIQNIKTALN